MGDFAPMNCPYCGSGPYSGVTLGDRHDDPVARSRWYDCESFHHFNTDMAATITEQCADRLLAQKGELAAKVEQLTAERDVHKEAADTYSDMVEGLRVERDRYRDALERIEKCRYLGEPTMGSAVARAALTPTEEQT